MSIVHVINSLDGLGGAELALLRLVSHADRARYRHSVVTLLGAARLHDAFAAVGVAVQALDARASGAFDTAQRIAALVRAPDAELVVGWLYYGNIAASVLGAARQLPVLWNVRHSTHDLERSGRSTRIALALSAALAAQPRAIVYNSVTVARQHAARRMRAGWSEVIENGIDTERFRPDEVARARWRATLGAQPNTRVIGRFGRYHALKGYADLIAAFARLRDAGDTLLVLGGRDVDERNGELRGLIAAAGIGARVRLLGERADLHDILPALDLFVSASHGESFPNVLAEAMACGVPGIATDVGASADIVAGTGWVVAADDVAHLGATIERALTFLRGQNAPLREHARAHIAQHYSLARMVTRYETLFAALTDSV